MASATALLLDLDGVLVDSRPQLRACFEQVAHGLGLDPPRQEVLARISTLSPRAAARRLFPGRDRWAVGKLVDAAFAEADSPIVAPGIPLLVEFLPDVARAVVTSRNKVQARSILTRSGLAPAFRCVVTWGDTMRHKPAPDPLQLALRLVGRGRGAYVGDAPSDMRAAKAGGLLAIGALWSSSFSAADLVRAGADVIVEEPMEILDCIERMDRHGLN